MARVLGFFYTASAPGRVSEQFTSDVEYKVDDELPLASARWHVERVDLVGNVLFEGVRYHSRHLHCFVE